ncbi:MAG: hypothetical protein JXA41_06330 [Deltaproteobacteria bacterium]|nr:hypothetical protein [Deltaproteobacteria bacterium]
MTHLLRLNEVISVEIKLDNADRSIIKKKVVVRSVQGLYVGCQFQEAPGTIDPDLGFYLRKNNP